MSTPITIPVDMQCAGNVIVAGIITSSTAFVTDALVVAGTNIAATKVIHQHQYSVQLYAPTTTVAALTQLLGGIRGTTSSLVEFWAAVITPPTTTDTVNVDLRRSTGGGAFATVLAGTILFNNSSAARTIVIATPTSTAVQGDLLEAVVTVTGTSAQGLIIGWTTRESAT
jgi:hypothetical protein